MRFWDTSALVPQDRTLAIWTLTPVEAVSALRRLVREKVADERAAHAAEVRLDELVRGAQLIVDIEATKRAATRLLRLHALRAFDALQLGAALQWADGRPDGRVLHTFDARLRLASQREGFVVP